MSELILHHNANYIRESLGFRVYDILGLRFKIAQYNQLAGRKHQELPEFLANKKEIMNVQNRDNRCIGYAVLAAVEDVEHTDHAYRHQEFNQLFRVYGIHRFHYPVDIENVAKFEDLCKANINVYSFYDDE